MNLNMGGQRFEDVKIPLIWGKRAILEDNTGLISIILLDGTKAVLEVLGNEPAPNIQYEVIEDGFKVINNGQELYSFDKERRVIKGLSQKLPECEIQSGGIRIGSNILSRKKATGFGVGVAVYEQRIVMGNSLPEGLARLVV
ncbi:MAG: hypothetical protein E2O82_00810 [Betaproteobacteria bacterium]|nr:MAG: hypothetical protein E2O82_00810 [Betaproteobacteria bacterium]